MAGRRNLSVRALSFGAPDRTNLEPAQLSSLLEELEEWGEVLKSEPEVIHRLSQFAAAASNGSDETGDTEELSQTNTEPEFPEPSP